MSTQFTEQFSKLSQKSLDNSKKLTDINNALFKNLVQQQLDSMTSYVEAASQHSSKLSDVKRVQDFWAVQAQFLQEANKIAMGNARSTLDSWVEAKNQFTSWYEDSLKQSAEYIPVKAK
jgi:hypothetical protein